MSEPRSLQRLVRLADVRTWWLIGAGVAMVMHALGMVGIETVAAALWFPGWIFFTLVITSKPNTKVSHAADHNSNSNTNEPNS